MKTYHFFYALTIIASLQACQSSDRKNRDDAATTAADSLGDTTQRAQTYTADVALTGDEKTFILPVVSGGMMEVEAGNLILQKSGNKAVKEFAAMMVKDHTKANHDLELIAKSKGIALPAVLPEPQMKHMEKMKELSGRSLDVHYVTMMIDDHANTEALFGQASRYTDQDLKRFILNTLPIIQMHHKKAVQLGKDLNISNANNGDDMPNIRPDTNQR